jgi:hypothetical protein
MIAETMSSGMRQGKTAAFSQMADFSGAAGRHLRLVEPSSMPGTRPICSSKRTMLEGLICKLGAKPILQLPGIC